MLCYARGLVCSTESGENNQLMLGQDKEMQEPRQLTDTSSRKPVSLPTPHHGNTHTPGGPAQAISRYLRNMKNHLDFHFTCGGKMHLIDFLVGTCQLNLSVDLFSTMYIMSQEIVTGCPTNMNRTLFPNISPSQA